MTTQNLEHLFKPKKIAVIGASERANNMGGVVIRNLLASDYQGEVIAVNPSDYKTVHGVACVRRVSKVPFEPDLSIVCTPAETVPKLVRQLGQQGSKVVMILTGGLSRMRSRSGRPLLASVAETAKEYGMRILGPNTIGIMVPDDNLNATFAHMGVISGHIAFIGQSGSMASAVIDWALARGIGFSHFISLGDGIDIDLADLVDYVAADRRVRAILLHLETISEARRFMSAVRVASRGKLVIAVKSGIVPESQWIPQEVPKGIRDGNKIYDVIFQRAGVLRVTGTDRMFDALESLTRMKRLRQHTLVVVANGVGPGIAATDALCTSGGELTKLAESTMDQLSELLPNYWSRRNPVDLPIDAEPKLFVQVLEVLQKDPGVANILVMNSPSLRVESIPIARAVADFAKRTAVNLMTCWLGQSTILPARLILAEEGLPTYSTPEKAVQAFMDQVNHQVGQRLLTETPPSYSEASSDHTLSKNLVRSAFDRGTPYLNNHDARTLLENYGIKTVPTHYCDDIEDVVNVHASLDQAVSVTILHEASALPFMEDQQGRGRYRGTAKRLNDAKALQEACQILFQQYQNYYPESGFLGYAVRASRQLVGGVVFNIGITRDAVFGPLIFCGAGGARANVINDRRLALPPLNMVLARELLQKTYAYRLLIEFSYQPEKDIKLLCQALVSVSQIALDLPYIDGLEVSPLVFTRDEVIAEDMAVSLAEPMESAIKPFPAELCEWIVLPKTKRKVELRPIRGEDEPAHREFFTHLSPESIRYRFFQYRKSFSHAELAQMTQIDYDREMVFIASAEKPDGGEFETLGVVRGFTDGDNVQTEFSVIVRDDQKGESLGYTLMCKLIEYCMVKGTLEIFGSVLPDNRPMLRLAQKLAFAVAFNEDEGVMYVRKQLNQPSSEWQKQRLAKLAL